MDAERIEELTGRPDKAFRADPKAPFTTIQRAAVIEGVHTEFILTSYSNMIFFVITQNEKLGSIVRTTLLTTPFGSLSTMLSKRELTLEGEATYSVTPLLGKRDPEIEIYARKLIEVTSQNSPKPLMLSLSLKNPTPATFRQIVAFVSKNIE